MTIKRQLLNFNQKSVDVRMGERAFDELPRIVSGAVGMPKRALLVSDAESFEEHGATVLRALVDAGFKVGECVAPTGTDAATLAFASMILERCGTAGLTADDVIVALGDMEVCSAAAFAAQLWRGGAASVLLPISLDAMIRLATEMAPLGIDGTRGAVSLRPMPTMVVCDLSLIPGMSEDHRLEGRTLIAGAALAEGKRTWGLVRELSSSIVEDDLAAFAEILGPVQIARRNVVKAANPSARHALSFGSITACSLARCLGEALPRWAMLAEGMRFEARLAVETAKFDPESVFDLDDLLDDLGVEEMGFSLDAEELVEAIKREQALRSNRFLLALPRSIGTIRMTAVPDDVLLRHADAYVASRKELLA